MKTRLHIYEEIKKYASEGTVRAHMPGHKGKKFSGFDASLDITESDGTDIVFAVKRAEKDCAEILGASDAFLLSGGASAGVFAAAYAIKKSGDKVVINRSAHKSVYNALKILGIEPIIADDREFARENFERTVIKEINKNKDAVGVFLTYPDYYGRIFDLDKISRAVKERGGMVVIDGAHGNAFRFLGLPYAGDFADIWVDGLHKTNYTFNQGAIVLSKEKKFASALKEGVGIFSTTSPCYPLLASCEYGIKRSFLRLKKDYAKKERYLKDLRDKTEKSGVPVLKNADPFKITALFGDAGINAYSAGEIIVKNGVIPELNDGNGITFMFSAASGKRDFIKTFRAVKKAVKYGKKVAAHKTEKETPERACGYLSAVNGEKEEIFLSEAAGRICAENFGEFPPCVPAAVAGEIIPESATRLKEGNSFGVYEGKVKVLKEDKNLK